MVDPLAANPSEKPSPLSLQQAAEWFARLRLDNATAEERQQWQEWFDSSHEHQLAWARVERISQRLAPISQSAAPHSAAKAFQLAQGRTLGRRQVLSGLALMVGSSALGWSLWQYGGLSEPVLASLAEQRSARGEIRSIRLVDGTRVILNTRTAFNSDYRQDIRRLHLIRGEVLIDSAADPRPLVVDSSGVRLRALGTRFSVRRQGHGRTLLAVFEGAVGYTLPGQPEQIVASGRQVLLDHQSLLREDEADPAREAWSRGILLSRNRPLAELLDELQQYRSGYLSLAPELADLHVIGAFPLDQPEQALQMLAAVLPIRVAQPVPWWTRITPRATE